MANPFHQERLIAGGMREFEEMFEGFILEKKKKFLACTNRAKFTQSFHDLCPAAEYDVPVALEGLGEVIHRAGTVAVLCRGGPPPPQ